MPKLPVEPYWPVSSRATGFPTIRARLSLTDDIAIEAILALIPMFAIGITAFATFSFSFIMRRIRFISLYLYISILFAFLAALLDLSQLLLRGATNVVLGLGIDAVRGFIDAREIFFALSFGFRFIYFWALVSGGLGEELSSSERHNDSWARWGIIGLFVKWLTLGASIAIPVLQVVWRIGPVTDSPVFMAVYIAETTMEITVSALFVLKILLTILISPERPRYRPIQYFSVPVIALLFSLAVAIGNLISTSFSETTLGRFLQAIELYILLLFVLVLAFRNQLPGRRSSSPPLAYADESKEKIVPRTFKSPPPRLPTPDYGMQNIRQVVVQPSRPPSTRIPSWMPAPRRPKRPDSSVLRFVSDRDSGTGDIKTEVRRQRSIPRRTVVYDDIAENDAPANSDGIAKLNPTLTSPGVQNLSELVQSQAPKSPRPSPSAPGKAARGPSPAPSNPPQTEQTIVRPSSPVEMDDAEPSGQSSEPETQTNTNRPITDNISLPSYYGAPARSSQRSSIPPAIRFSDRAQGSPVYGLEGIVRQLPGRRFSSSSDTRTRDSGTSFDQLLKQQADLDRSIQALKLFSPRTTIASFDDGKEPTDPKPLPESVQLNAPPPPPSPPPLTKTSTGDRMTSGSTSFGGRIDSASVRSEFSLSVFPDPPARQTSRSRPITSLIGPRSPTSPRSRFDLSSQILPENVPGSPNADTPQAVRMDSAVTQYDVTSFIGDLTVPTRRSEDDDVPPDMPDRPESEVNGDDGQAPLRPLMLKSNSPPKVQSIPYTPRDGTGRDPLKPLILGIGRGAKGRQTRLDISGPRPPRLEEEAEDAFERPRPPPIVTSSSRTPIER